MIRYFRQNFSGKAIIIIIGLLVLLGLILALSGCSEVDTVCEGNECTIQLACENGCASCGKWRADDCEAFDTILPECVSTTYCGDAFCVAGCTGCCEYRNGFCAIENNTELSAQCCSPQYCGAESPVCEEGCRGCDQWRNTDCTINDVPPPTCSSSLYCGGADQCNEGCSGCEELRNADCSISPTEDPKCQTSRLCGKVQKSCTEGCAGCGIQRNSDCSEIPTNNIACLSTQFCGRQFTTCEEGCAACGLYRNADCSLRETDNEECRSSVFCGLESRSCDEDCVACNVRLNDDCSATISPDICKDMCNHPYEWPSEGTVYGWKDCKVDGHRGLDIRNGNREQTFGSDVFSITGGEIIDTRIDCPDHAFDDRVCKGCGAGEVGNCVRLKQNDGRYSVYGHLSQVLVEIGDKVPRGKTIGRIGNSGKSSGPHLHFEITRDSGSNNLVNPCSFPEYNNRCESICSLN